MRHLVEREQWDDEPPRSLAYLCGALRKGDGESEVSNSLVEFLERRARVLWPSTGGDDGFRWELLWDDKQSTGPERLEAQYVRANLDPSDRYVQSLPGTGRYRIPPGDTGFDNLAIAGDWTATGLDAGCIEAAVRSGVMAAEHILAGSAGRLPRTSVATWEPEWSCSAWSARLPSSPVMPPKSRESWDERETSQIPRRCSPDWPPSSPGTGRSPSNATSSSRPSARVRRWRLRCGSTIPLTPRRGRFR